MAPLVESGPDVRRVTAWKCIGCGRVEAPQPCIGVCSDRKVELVDARDYEIVRTKLEQLEAEYARLVEFLRMMARNNPREDRWEESYRHLQAMAEGMLDRGEQ
ncbi:MAG TPA: hypothetical protein VFA48_07335 [Gammaproteobacteria bacterium]|nr:hypothetical protein [Gammaproteobacteria bacterium]